MDNTIPLTPVTSSQIEAVGYDEASKTLAVQFKKGSVYHYANVPAEIYQSFSKAESLGRFFGTNIKAHPDRFPFKKVPSKPA